MSVEFKVSLFICKFCGEKQRFNMLNQQQREESIIWENYHNQCRRRKAEQKILNAMRKPKGFQKRKRNIYEDYDKSVTDEDDFGVI